MGARLRHYRRQAVRPVREHRYCPKFTPRHWAGRTPDHLGGLERAHGGFFGDSGGENTVYQNVLHEFDAESPDFGAVVESYSFFVGLRVVVLTKSGHVQRLVRNSWNHRTEALRRAASGWAHGAIKATSVEIFRGY